MKLQIINIVGIIFINSFYLYFENASKLICYDNNHIYANQFLLNHMLLLKGSFLLNALILLKKKERKTLDTILTVKVKDYGSLQLHIKIFPALNHEEKIFFLKI